MALLCDKYKPTSLSKLDYNLEQAKNIKKMIEMNDFPHLFVYGIPGAGKKTRVQCFLKEIYGSGVEKLRIENKTFTVPSGKKIDLKLISSNFHCEVNPSDLSLHDRVVVQELVKEIASSGIYTEKVKFKVIVITEADKLTKDAQHSLRRTMEKYITRCRIILIGNSSSRLIPAIKSRCLLVRVAAPTEEKIVEILLNVAKKECINLNTDLAKEISEVSERNLRRALLMLESTKLNNNKIFSPQWQQFIKKMAKDLLCNQSVQTLNNLRNDFYELQIHLIPPETVFVILVNELILSCDFKLKSQLIKLAAFYEHKMKLGSKPIFYFEAFVAHFMSIYKKFIEQFILDDFEMPFL